jgi:hypothetical protein
VAKRRQELKLGRAFSRGHFKRLRREDETWEADFRALPKPIMQSQTHYLGIVVTKQKGMVLAETHVAGRPEANDLAALLAQAMRRPAAGKAHRPRRLHLRGHPQWRELFPHLEKLDIKVAVRQELPKATKGYENFLRRMKDTHRAKMVKPSPEQAAVDELGWPTTSSGRGSSDLWADASPSHGTVRSGTNQDRKKGGS